MSLESFQMDAETIASAAPSLRGRRFLAACGSIVFTGLGHAIAGRWQRGLFWLGCDALITVLTCIAFAYAALTPALLVLAPLSLALTIIVIVDACKIARRSPSPMLSYPALRYWLGSILIAGLLILHPTRSIYAPLLQRYITQAFVMPTNSMSPTITPGDRLLASRLQHFHRWSIVAFRSPEDGRTFFLKRIAALPGETIEIKNGGVLINGHHIPQPAGLRYVGDDPRIRRGGTGHPMKLASDEYFVLGDNSPVSEDSRYWTKAAPAHQAGALPASYIIGPATWIYWPWHRIKRVDQN